MTMSFILYAKCDLCVYLNIYKSVFIYNYAIKHRVTKGMCSSLLFPAIGMVLLLDSSLSVVCIYVGII